MEHNNFGRSLCLAVDMQSYSKRLGGEQEAVQRDLVRIVETAAIATRLPLDQWRVQQQGDGMLVLAPLDDVEPRYLDTFIRHLDTELGRHNRRLVAEAELRLRVALHHGVAYPAANGFAGDAAILVCRLLDASVCRDVLADSGGNLVLIVSDEVYRDTVLPEHTLLRPGSFTRVDIDENKLHATGWVWLPSGAESQTLAQARENGGKVPPGPLAGRSITQNATTITNVRHMKTRTAVFGTVQGSVYAGDDDD
jgi:hypothetical protein